MLFRSNDTATTEIYTLSLHDALPISMEAAAKDDSYAFPILGGQNPLAMFCEGADKIDLSNLSNYDQGCNEEFQNAMKNYFEGGMSYEEALNLFYKAVVEKYPELTY